MEDAEYSALKSSLSSVSAKALNNSSRIKLANHLDNRHAIISKHGVCRDYRGLADLMGIPVSVCLRFEKSESPTQKILETWETSPNATLDKLLTFLEEMDRYDAIEEIVPFLEKNAESYLQYQRSLESPIQVAEVSPGPMNVHFENEGGPVTHRGAITRDDLMNGEDTMYDAYASYADDDTHIVADFAEFLESPRVGLKLFIPGRDLLVGVNELDSKIELIKNRCRRMLIFLTPNFMKSPALEFQVSFAGSLAIEQRKRILIPVILAPCDIPLILSSVSKIDFTKDNIQDWMWEKLITSLMPEENLAYFLSSLGRNPLRCKNMVQCSTSDSSRPSIIFPQTVQYSVRYVDNTESALAITSADSSDFEMKDSALSSEEKYSVTCCEVKDSTEEHLQQPVASTSTASPSSKRFKSVFTSIFKRKGNSPQVSSTISFSSGATSGFHSQSYSDNSANNFNSDTSL